MADYSAKGWTLVYNNHYSEHLNQEKQNIYFLHNFTKYKNNNVMIENFFFFFYLTGHNPRNFFKIHSALHLQSLSGYM